MNHSTVDSRPITLPTVEWTLNRSRPDQLGPWLDIRVKRGDTLSGLFDQVDLEASQWRTLLSLGDTVDALRELHLGDKFRLRKTADGRIAVLHFPLNTDRTLVVRRTNDGLTAQIQRVNVTTRRVLVQGVVDASFPASLRRAGVPSQIASTLAHIYKRRKNLSKAMNAGDRFSIIYAAEFVGGSRINTGPIIAAGIRTNGEIYRVFRQVNAEGEVHYYSARGRPYAPDIERTPLDYTAISSPFNMNRMHPILDVVRPHTGVDLAAPGGTPVHAAGTGTVTFVGWISGYGRMVKIDHGQGYSTYYTHLSGFTAGLDEGDHVTQGQTIAFVGQSGLTTGYNLHYEILKNGTPRNPMTMALPKSEPLSGIMLAAFTRRIQPLIARLNGRNATPRTMAANVSFGTQSG